MIKALIFDFDGVIHDTFELSHGIHQQAGNKFSLDQYRDFFNGNVYDNKTIKSINLKKYFSLQNFQYKKLIIKPEIRNELIKLARVYELFVISSNMETALHGYFKNNKINHIIQDILGLEAHKSKIDKFKILIERHGLNFESCVFITDTLGDILEANKVGLKTIAVDFGFHERARLKKGKPHKIVSDFKEIIKEIKKL